MTDKQAVTTKTDDGGPAFPLGPVVRFPGTADECVDHPAEYDCNEGMTLRDWFAGQVFPILLKQVECEPTIKISSSQDFEAIKQASERIKSVASIVSMMAYAHADSMIAHRNGGAS